MTTKRLLAVCVAALVSTPALQAQPGAAGLDMKEVDQRIYKLLKDVINTGADLYNNRNDHNGCYRLYQGSLMTLRPMLDHRPAMQKVIDEALEKAKRAQNPGDSAFDLRAAIDRIRDETGGKPKVAAKATLWDRLGGEKNVRKVIDDFVDLAGSDPKVDFFRGGNYKLSEKEVADLKQKLVEFVSAATGGPLKYTGKDMKTVHKGMGISDDQFNAIAADLKEALDKNGAKPEDRDAVLAAVGTTRKDIVEPAKEPTKKEAKEEDGKKEPKKEPVKKEDKEPVKKGETLEPDKKETEKKKDD
jgi:hemoglobin